MADHDFTEWIRVINGCNGNVTQATNLLGINRTIIYYWAKRDESLRRALEEWRTISGLSPEETEALLDSRRFIERLDQGSGYSEADLQNAIACNLEHIIARLGLPPIADSAKEYMLLDQSRIDFVVSHADNTFSLIEVKTCQRSPSNTGPTSASWLLYSTIGQLLHYFEAFVDTCHVPRHLIRLFVFSDYDPTEYYLRSLNHVSLPIKLVNVKPLLRTLNQGTETYQRSFL